MCMSVYMEDDILICILGMKIEKYVCFLHFALTTVIQTTPRTAKLERSRRGIKMYHTLTIQLSGWTRPNVGKELLRFGEFLVY